MKKLLIMGMVVLLEIFSWTTDAYSGEEQAYRQLIKDYGKRPEYEVLDTYFRVIARIKPRSTQAYRPKINIRDLLKKREYTPLSIERGVTTFKERRAFDYGRRNRNKD